MLLPEVHCCAVHYSPGCTVVLVQWCQPTWGPPSALGLFLGHLGTHQHLSPSEPLQGLATVPQWLQRGQEPLHVWPGGQAFPCPPRAPQSSVAKYFARKLQLQGMRSTLCPRLWFRRNHLSEAIAGELPLLNSVLGPKGCPLCPRLPLPAAPTPQGG